MYRGDIHWVDFGQNIGSVQSGRRPAIVIQNDRLSLQITTRLVVPLTSNLGTRRFRGTVGVPKTSVNGLRQDSLAMAFQTTAVDILEIGPGP